MWCKYELWLKRNENSCNDNCNNSSSDTSSYICSGLIESKYCKVDTDNTNEGENENGSRSDNNKIIEEIHNTFPATKKYIIRNIKAIL